MDARTISAGLSVSEQITPNDVENLAKQGFRTIICNRPDGEADGQPTFAEIAAAAQANGITARHLPVTPGQISDAGATQFAEFLKDLPGPVLAYCRTGTRSAMLWSIAMAEVKPLTDILAATQAAGCDMSPLLPRLATRATRPTVPAGS